MGLTRSSSGLLVFDAFDSNTLANYTKANASTWAVTSGVMQKQDGNSDSLKHTATSTCKCVTAAHKHYAGNWQGVGVCAGADVGSFFRSYCYEVHSTSGAYLGEYDTADAWTEIDSNADYDVAAHQNQITRVYTDGTTVTARAGNTDLSGLLLSGADSSLNSGSGFMYGSGYYIDFAWFELRTAHTVTCSGLPANWQFQVTDGTTTVKATASGGTATVDAGTVLFPFTEVMVLDGSNVEQIHILAATLADMGGGDAFAYTAAATREDLMLMGVG